MKGPQCVCRSSSRWAENRGFLHMTRTLLVACLSIGCLCGAGPAVAQTPDRIAKAVRRTPAAVPEVNPLSPSGSSDPVWEGLFIGGAIGAVGGMIVAPPLFCGHNDPECTAVVRVAIGLPIMAGGFVAGALIDKFHQRGHLVWTSRSGRRVAQIDPLFVHAGAGVRLSARFR